MESFGWRAKAAVRAQSLGTTSSPDSANTGPGQDLAFMTGVLKKSGPAPVDSSLKMLAEPLLSLSCSRSAQTATPTSQTCERGMYAQARVSRQARFHTSNGSTRCIKIHGAGPREKYTGGH